MCFSDDDGVQIRELGRPGDLGWMVKANGELYAREFGWNGEYEALVARIVADYAAARDPRAGAWIAELGGERVGCVLCVSGEDAGTAVLRVLLVDPRARGQRLGDRLVTTVLNFATGAGYSHIRLWTNDVLGAARRIYLRHGFALTGSEPHHSFGTDLVGQVYERDL